jgi:hypothetical protein
MWSGDLEKHHKASMAFDERRDVRVVCSGEKVSFPVAWHGAVLHLRRAALSPLFLQCGDDHRHIAKNCDGSTSKIQIAANQVATRTTMTAPRITLPHMNRL